MCCITLVLVSVGCEFLFKYLRHWEVDIEYQLLNGRLGTLASLELQTGMEFLKFRPQVL